MGVTLRDGRNMDWLRAKIIVKDILEGIVQHTKLDWTYILGEHYISEMYKQNIRATVQISKEEC